MWNKILTTQSRGSGVWRKASKRYMEVLRQQGLFSLRKGKVKRTGMLSCVREKRKGKPDSSLVFTAKG